MKNLIILLTIILFISCEEKVSFQDARLLVHAENIQNQLKLRDIDIDININMVIKQDLNNKGVIVWGMSTGNTIYVNKKAYDTNYENNPKRIEALVAHELGHNRLNLEHVDSRYYTDSLKRPMVMHTSAWQNITENNINDMYDNLSDYMHNK